MNYSLIDYYKIFWKNKKRILLVTLIAGLLSFGVAFFVLKPVYLSTGTVKASTKSGGLSSLLAVGGLGDLGGFEELTGGGSSQELALYENIIKSRRCLEEVIMKYNLNSTYEYKFNDDLVKFIREELIEVTKDSKASTMVIGFYDENPEKAKEITEFLIFQLNKINSELNIENAKNNKEFIEARFNATKEELRKAEDSLKNFQNIYGVAPDIVVKSAVQTEVQLEAQIKSEEVKLDILKKILSQGQPELKQQEEKIIALNKQLFEMRNNTERSGILNLKGAPDVVINFIRLQRDVEIYNKILAFLVPVYENAKIEEKKETTTVLVLDQPFVPQKKAKPKRATIILACMAIAFSLGCFYYFSKYKLKNLKADD